MSITTEKAGASSASGILKQKITIIGNDTKTFNFAGEIRRVTFKPGTGLEQPTSYTVTWTDEAGVDLLSGLAAGLSTTVAFDKVPTLAASDGTTVATAPRAVNDLTVLTSTNVGAGKKVTMWVYYREFK